MGARSHVKLHQVLDQLTGWVNVVNYIRGRYEMCDSVARSTEFSVDLPNSHKIYRSTDLNLKSTEKLLKKIFII
jgi:hypothetical protein